MVSISTHLARTCVVLALGLGGCEARIPEGRFACEVDEDCPPEMVCDVAQERCFSPDAGVGD